MDQFCKSPDRTGTPVGSAGRPTGHVAAPPAPSAPAIPGVFNLTDGTALALRLEFLQKEIRASERRESAIFANQRQRDWRDFGPGTPVLTLEQRNRRAWLLFPREDRLLITRLRRRRYRQQRASAQLESHLAAGPPATNPEAAN
ncbi:hypothetical protein [Paludibaculum fermentans]|uniref:Uncharacterized protein n=1 Tax=Paludibaculum fermentans TaxID=1473598 RepID=A0A7S7SJN9_PALFE|nr:hypothetical protein [Paludibaculum fermentans]QOY87444.1 hypothetical protein IRI77_32575 [Paludibaculum fermentans]